ncbi:MAG: UDP-glucose--hexose-1-phosphate uridylyltransferase [Candidatus Acidiferrales bacterium]
MNSSPFNETPHRRFNPLTREWVLVSPHRAERPWLGKVEKAATAPLLTFDPNCYLCPGNARAAGVRNPEYQSTFVFDNDFPALLPGAPEGATDEEGLFVARTGPGICRVVCFTPRHDLAIPRMSLDEIRRVIDVWAEQYLELGARPSIRHVQIFENRGALMGASNPHPHCQIWADAALPNIPAREMESLREYRERHGSCLLCRYLELELARNERIVCANDDFAALVPYWAVWPFEAMILSRRHVQDLAQLGDRERNQLAELMRRLTIRYDNLFETPFPYSMGFHQRPTDGQEHAGHHLHAHYFPPLLRSADVRKFMVGYELLATPQRDLTPESAAARLRDMAETHYLDC